MEARRQRFAGSKRNFENHDDGTRMGKAKACPPSLTAFANRWWPWRFCAFKKHEVLRIHAQHAVKRAEPYSPQADNPAILPNPDCNFFRNERRVERIMLRVAQHELEGVLAGRQIEACLGLTRSEMKMALVLCDRLVGIEWFV